MKGATLFSGIGGVDAGMVEAGINPVAAVECDPDRPEYSKAMAIAHKRNFPGSQFFLSTVQSFDWQALAALQPDIVHASPMCSHFCPMAAVSNTAEAAMDIASGVATADGIEAVYPAYFSLEQAPNYAESESYTLLRIRLAKMGYRVRLHFADTAHYGVPQHRKRMFALCSRSDKPEWKFPETSRVMGWREAIAGLEDFELDTFTPRQQARVDQERIESDLIIQRVSASKKLVVRRPNEPCWTIQRDHFYDHKGGMRQRVATARIEGKVRNLSIRAIARLCSFPDWFWLPPRYAGMGLGYAVPPLMMKKIYQMLS